MRYQVWQGKHALLFHCACSCLAEAASIFHEDQEGRMFQVFDDEEKRWVSGAELLLAYVTAPAETI